MPSKKAQLKKQLIAYSFIAPNFIGFAVFTLVPIVFAFALAFLHWDGSNPITWAGLSNFKDLFDDDQFKAALWNTIVYAGGTVPLTLACSLFLAVVLNQGVKGKSFFRTVSFFPYVASLVAVAAVWNMIFNPEKGPVNMALLQLGFEKVPGWAADRHWAMVTIILFSVWKYMGYYMIIYLAGLQGINSELYEAANLDGANIWQRFRFVTVPQLRPTTFFVLVMLTIQCFKVYDIVYMITQAGPGTATLVLVYDIYNKAFISWNLGSASAVAMVLFILVLTVTLVQFQGEKKMK
ncbi:MAG TPA: sugar ABC transporter permease [Sphaerochaeta sp.]|nr:sugar ABC transporter permease [Sphaerochaeta sp.]